MNDDVKKNDYEINYLMRKKFRAEKKKIKVSLNNSDLISSRMLKEKLRILDLI